MNGLQVDQRSTHCFKNNEGTHVQDDYSETS